MIYIPNYTGETVIFPLNMRIHENRKAFSKKTHIYVTPITVLHKQILRAVF